MLLKRALILAPFIVLLAACQEESAPPLQTSSSASQPAAARASTPASSSSVISVTPASLQDCDNGVAATVKWDASKAKVTTNGTEIWVGADDASMQLFSAGGASGEAKTGPWTHPGTHFLLKNKQDGKSLGEAVVGGPACK
ncbi:hypothetical protein [Dyella mobilis]|uniref:C-type lysozyme inhibitor domain-containing protein n=1 Tax=Dyella mobilis TaxID=1849582 RepID=A0ABS2KNF3_9GAMM|nr:hypothetical protein [Dyella mobilis]MBM7132342.1 hypothetical protein [Dyella mobilis]GLQ95670.1 hypothetical protein GCM10007863_00880 [Dyella mobilis]